MTPDAEPAGVPLKSVALPAEHGGWGLVLEPLVLGLAVAPSWGAAFVGLAFLGGFLLHHPLKLVLADARRRTAYPRTFAALRVAAVYAAVAALGLVVALAFASGPFWIPIAAAVPFAGLQLAFDARNKSRHVVPEMAGVVALAAVAPAELLASGWSAAAAVALWCVIAGRGIASVVYVRTRLRLDRGQAPDTTGALFAHAGLLLVALLLVAAELLPVAGVVVAGLLLVRAVWGLSPWHRVVRPQAVGFQEVGVGVLTVLVLAIGYRLTGG